MKEFKIKLDAIAESSLSGKERSEAIKELVANYGKKEPMTPYFKKYYMRVGFVVFYFLVLGGLSYYSLRAMFGTEGHVSTEAIGIINLILGGLMGKISDIFSLIKNGD